VTRIVQNKTRPSRALCGKPLWGASNDPANDRNYPPGQHGVESRGHRKSSAFGEQLRAKQMLRKYYNITEKQFKNTFVKASKMKGNTGQNFIQLLECRLDAIVYRATFGRSVFACRQLVSHGHITVNGKRVKIPSYSAKPGDIIAVAEKSKDKLVILDSVSNAEREVPEYVQLDAKKLEATYLRLPEDENEVPYAVQMNVHLIVEFYSR